MTKTYDQTKVELIPGKIDERLSLDPVLSSKAEDIQEEPEVFEAFGEIKDAEDYGLSDDEYTKPASEIDKEPLNFSKAQRLMQSLNSPIDGGQENTDEKYLRLMTEFAYFKKEIEANDARNATVDEIISELTEYSISGRLSTRQYSFVKDSVDSTSTKYNVIFKSLDPRQIQYTRELEKRVAKLEQLIGIQTLDDAEVSESRVFKLPGNMATVLEKLNFGYDTISDHNKLTAALGTLKESKEEFEELILIRRKMKLEGLDRTDEQKLELLYAEMKKLLPAAKQLPALVSRLQSLDEIHTDSKLHIEQIKLIVEEQKSLQQLVNDLTTGIRSLQLLMNQSKIICDQNIMKLRDDYK